MSEPGLPTADALPDAAHIQQQAQGLLRQLSEASEVQAQISRAVALAFTAITALVMLTYGASGLRAPLDSTATSALWSRLGASPSAWLALGLGGAHLIACLWLLRASAVKPYTGRSLVLLNLPFYLASLWLLGASPVLVLPVLVVWTHLLVSPREALWITLPLVGITGLAALMQFDAADQVSAARVLIASVLISLLLHIMTSRSRRTQDAAHAVTRNLQGLTERLDRDLLRASAERDEARTTDPASGLLNARGLEAVLAHRLTPSPPQVWWLLALRWPGLQDALAAADAAAQQRLRQRLAAQLRAWAGPHGAVATDGRFEFTLLLRGEEGDEASMPRTLARIGQTLAQPQEAGSALLLTPPLAGANRYPRPARSASDLLRGAEIALMHAVATSAADPVLFADEMATAVAERASMIEALQRAIETDGFELHYQPIFALAGGRLHKAEALIRWVHPQRGRLSPATFIPLAEETGQVAALTEWVLAKVAGQVREWRQSLRPDFQVSVNMPPAYLQAASRNPQEALRRLRALDIPAGGVVLEITEGALLRVDDALLHLLRSLRGLGLRISLDDFGMGYSSFSQLDRLPLDVLKIDKAFVDEIESSSRRLAICEAVVRVGHALGLEVVAEGVQTDRQRDLLRETGCDFGQGYGFAPPLPAAELAALAQRESAPALGEPAQAPAPSEGSSTR